MNIAAANRECLRRMLEGTAHLTDVRLAREALPGPGARMLLHAGPPIGWPRMCGPLRGAVIGACLFEGWAATAEEAAALAASGTPIGIDIRKVVERGITPAIDTGIAHREPGVGQIGAGLAWAPLECFTQALDAVAHAQGVA